MVSAIALRSDSFIQFAVTLLVLSALLPPFATAQVNGDADEITAFLTNHVLVEEISAELLAVFDARFDEDADEARQYLGNWDEMTRDEKIARVRAMTGPPPAIEWLPGLGVVAIEEGEYHQSRFDRVDWAVEQDDGRVVLRTSSSRSGMAASAESEITFYDGSRIVWVTRAQGPHGAEEEFTTSYVAEADSDDRGRQKDAAALADTWTLVRSGDASLEGFPTITYVFHPDGSFEIFVSEVTPSRAADMAGVPDQGYWGLTISQVVADDFDTGDESSGRLLVLASSHRDHESHQQMFVLEHLDDSTMTLTTELDTGVARLHFSR